MSNETIFDMNTSSSNHFSLCDKCVHKDVCKYRNWDFIKGNGIYMEVHTCPYHWKKKNDCGIELYKIQENYEVVEKRLKHLLQSDFIRRFDEKCIDTGEYVRDINDIDRLFYGDGSKEENQ